MQPNTFPFGDPSPHDTPFVVMLRATYNLGGGSVYLEEYGRLCFCPAHGKGSAHATDCDQMWDAYQAGLSAMQGQVNDRRLTTDSYLAVAFYAMTTQQEPPIWVDLDDDQRKHLLALVYRVYNKWIEEEREAEAAFVRGERKRRHYQFRTIGNPRAPGNKSDRRKH